MSYRTITKGGALIQYAEANIDALHHIVTVRTAGTVAEGEEVNYLFPNAGISVRMDGDKVAKITLRIYSSEKELEDLFSRETSDAREAP